MSGAEATPGRAVLDVRNVGGIEETHVEFEPGLTVLAGRNATNRTSLLQALAGALGSDHVSLKSDASEGEVTLALDGRTYTRTLDRTGAGVARGGDPYLADAEAADLFAFLLGDNEARAAVRRGGDLRELIMRPVDTAAIRREIDDLAETRAGLDEELAELDRLAEELPGLEERRTRLTRRIEEAREELTEARETLADLEDDPAKTQADREVLDEKMSALSDARNELESVEFEIETQQESLASLREERESAVADLEALPAVEDAERERLAAEIDRLEERKQSLSSTVNRLQRIVQFNEDLLEGDRPPELDALAGPDRSVTDDLLGDDREVVCWTCGSTVERGAIDDTVSELRDLRASLVAERKEVDEELDALRERLDELVDRDDERERLVATRRRIDDEIDRREATLADHRERREELIDEIAALEETVEELRGRDHEEMLAAQQTVSEREYEVDRLTDERDEVVAEIEAVEERLAERDDLTSRREAVQRDLEAARNRIADLEADAVEAFNEHMETLLSILAYENVERVWIERTDGGSGSVEGTFDLHVVRDTADGTVYEDSVDHLSESEREVIGLVFALAGYLAHDLAETVPFILLDSLEAIDAERIAALVDYFRSYSPYLVVALLPDDAAAVEADQRVTEI